MMISSSVLLSSPLGFVTAVSVTFPVTVKVYGLSVETREPFSVHSTNVSPLGTVAVTVTLVPSSNVPLVLPPESEPPITVTVYVTGCGSGSSSGLHSQANFFASCHFPSNKNFFVAPPPRQGLFVRRFTPYKCIIKQKS